MDSDSELTARPRLPKELYEKSTAKSLLTVAYSVALWVGATIVTSNIWLGTLPILWKIALSLPLFLIGGQGMVIAGYLGHDAFHFSLHKNRIVSCIIGIFATAPLFPFMEIGFAISHWNHHTHTNTTADPDGKIFGRFHNAFTRALFARPLTFLVYGRNAIYLALGKPLPLKTPFPLKADVVKRLARFNLFISLSMATVHVILLFTVPVIYFCLLGSRLSSAFLSGMNPYFEHAGTGDGLGFDSRSRVGWIWDIMFVGSNYHLEHHLYPGIPAYNLKRTHEYLREIGYYKVPRHVESGIGVYRFLGSRYPYPRKQA